MTDVKIVEGQLTARDLRIGIVASRFNSFIVEQLVQGAIDALRRHGAREQDITLARIPGAWEMPIVVQRMAASRRFDAIIALGAVIRGATPHFDYVAGECAKGIAQASMSNDVPVAFGVVTCNTMEQAKARIERGSNKGWEAALAAIEMTSLYRKLG